MAEVPKPMRQQVQDHIHALQDKIVGAFEELDPNAPKFRRDSWVRAQGGTGRSYVFAVPAATASTQASTILEKAGVNISVVHGMLPPAAIQQMRADHAGMPGLPEGSPGLPFFAAGLSLVVHPRNPHAPTVHLNYRYFEITSARSTSSDADSDSEPGVLAWWFGGGSDLTPSYLYEEDAKHFHGTLKSACDAHGASLFPTMKTWCDEYFMIKHRGERRGLGGIFFDDLSDGPHKRFDSPNAPRARPSNPEQIFALVRDLGDAFVPSYIPILTRRANIPYTPEQRRWQLLRRGRYVEFNLVYDRGTKFGLATPGARIESILMSLPEEARWEYESDMGGPGTEEGRLMDVLKVPNDWA